MFSFPWVWVTAMIVVTSMISFTFLRPGLAMLLTDRTYTPLHIAAVFAIRPAAYLIASGIAATINAEHDSNLTSRSMIVFGLLLVSISYWFLADGYFGLMAVVGVTLGATLAFVPTMNTICQIVQVESWIEWEYTSLVVATLFAIGECLGPFLAGVLTWALGDFDYASSACSTFALVVAAVLGALTYGDLVKDKLKETQGTDGALSRQKKRRNEGVFETNGNHADERQPLLS